MNSYIFIVLNNLLFLRTSGLGANVNVQKFQSLFGELTSLRSKAAYSASISSAWGSVEKTIWDSRLRASSLWCCLSAQSHGVSLFSFSANRSPPRFTRNYRGVRREILLIYSSIDLRGHDTMNNMFLDLWKHTVYLMHKYQHISFSWNGDVEEFCVFELKNKLCVRGTVEVSKKQKG